MLIRLITNEIKKNKTITLITAAFMTAAAMLISLSAILTLNLSGAIDTLMEQSATPHFMQMHSGTIDTGRMAAFAAGNEMVADYQILEFLNLDGAEFSFGDTTLAESVQDNGLSPQSSRFDYLLDLNGEIIRPAGGEIYVPLCYQKEGRTEAGRTMTVAGQEFVVAGFMRDSQMNSLLSSSKRFIVSDADYEQLKEMGKTEYLIEFRLHDLQQLSAFETIYSQSGLEAGGPALTYPLFKMINAISDGILIAVILLVSLLLMIIAFLCIRFTLLARIEEDYREIGVMKAIGLRNADIKKLYLFKYVCLSGISCLVGYLLSLLSKGWLLRDIRLSMGESAYASLAVMAAALLVFAVFLMIIGFVYHVLHRFEKISAVSAIRFGAGEEAVKHTNRFCLSRYTWLNVNILMGIKDICSRGKIYLTMLVVLVIACFIMIVPQNLYQTVSSEEFIRYKGIGKCEIRMDIQQTDRIEEKAMDIAAELQRDGDVLNHTVLTTKTLAMKTADGTAANLKVELGDHKVFPIEYPVGRAPANASEIALSSLNASEYEMTVGDTVTLVYEGQEMPLTVCGIYSDFTNGGKSAKAVFTAPAAATAWSIIYVSLKDPAVTGQVVNKYMNAHSYAKIADIQVYMQQQFGSTIQSIRMASYGSLAVSVLVTILIVMLFMKMLIAKEQPAIAAMKALGFTDGDIRQQFMTRSIVILIFSMIIGTILSNTVGESLAGAAISSFGAFSFHFIINPYASYVFCPVMLVCAVLIATILGSTGIETANLIETIKE